MKLITIVVPIYNVEKYIRRCLDSILNQTFTNYEVLMIDDGSTDSSSEICDEYQKKYSNFKAIHKQNGGLGYARNTGIENANGDYIVFIDGDDYISNNHIENIFMEIEKNKADACYCGYTRYLRDGKKVENPHVYAKRTFQGEEIKTKLIPKMCGKKNDGSDGIEMSVCMAIFSSNIIKKHNLKFYSEREVLSEDILFNIDFYSKSDKISICDDVGYFYCDNEGSLTTTYRADRFKRQKSLTKELIKRTKEMGIFDLCEERLYTTFIAISRYSIKLEQKFYKQIGKKTAKDNIRNICKDEMLKDILKTYDNSKVQFKSRIVNYLVKYEKVNLLWLVMSLKNSLNI